jgi:hypothetical protein
MLPPFSIIQTITHNLQHVYKITKVLKADPRYSTWVDIIRAKGALPNFSELSDQAREFFAAEITQEQQQPAIEGACKTNVSLSSIVKCEHCGYSRHKKADCRFFRRDKEKGELKPNGCTKRMTGNAKAQYSQQGTPISLVSCSRWQLFRRQQKTLLVSSLILERPVIWSRMPACCKTRSQPRSESQLPIKRTAVFHQGRCHYH